jgi:hypothetical protein
MSLLQMLSFPFMQRALIAGVLVSLCCALLGVSLVLKRYSMIGDGLSHVSFGALAIAVALGFTPLYFSIPVVVLAAFFLLRMAGNPRWNSDAAIAAVSASSLAVGIMVISRTTGMTTDVDNYMFGSVLAMSRADVALSVLVSIAVLSLFVLFYHKLFAVTFYGQAGVQGDRRAAARHSGADHRAGHADDGGHADLLPDHLPRPDGHAALQELPRRDPLRRRHLSVLLLHRTNGVLCLFHPGGRHGGVRQSSAVFDLLRRQRPAALTACEKPGFITRRRSRGNQGFRILPSHPALHRSTAMGLLVPVGNGIF